MSTFAPFARPLYVMLKPVGSKCNLNCDYCYYLEKENLYNNRNQVMSENLLERFIKQYIDSQTMPDIMFTWHGGETLMRPISFYKKAIELQKKYANGRNIDNSIQTNGTLLNDDWCKFFKENNFLVGISIDGPKDFHDEYRRDKMGRPSFHRVMKGIELLKKHGVEFNCMAVVNDYNVDYPLEFYNFFKDIDCKYIQFTPIVERLRIQEPTKNISLLKLATAKEDDHEAELAPFTVNADKWGDFLCSIFDEWVKEDVGKIFVQIFDSTLANWVGENPGVCTMAKTCGHAGVMEFNGDFIHEKRLNFKQDIDVRGMRGDEALQAVIYFIDDALQLGISRVRVLHGTGTGALRQIIREYLGTVNGVANFQDEHVQFGGAGITVIDLE